MGKANEGFSEERNKEFVEFCRATGLRRSEITHLKPENLSFDNTTGKYVITLVKGKGGKLRDCPIVSADEKDTNANEAINRVIERMQNTADGQFVWDKVPTRADIHSYRADYCKTIYNLHARPIDEIPKKERYYCRGDRKGVVYDRRAMAVASRALGHNRIGVIAGHYLYERAGGINFLPTANK